MSIELSIISQVDVYHGWPTIARRRNGQLLVVASAGRQAHVCPFGQVWLQRSDDDGVTWSAPEVVCHGPLDDRDAGVIETRAGTLIVNWFTSLAWLNYLYRQEIGQVDWLPPETQAVWRQERERVATKVAVRDELGDWAVRSEDGGKTWSARVPTRVSSPHGPIELADGRLLYAGKRTTDYANWTRGSAHEGGCIAVAESLDDGCSWAVLSEVACAPGHAAADYHEPHLVEARSGRLVLQIRNHGEPHLRETLQCESEDGGKSWTTPHSIGVWGLPSHLLRLRDDRLLMTYGYRRQPYGNLARTSSDDGETWSAPITVSDDGHSGDLGYPSSVQLADGSLLTVWYERLRDLDPAVLRQARWRLDSSD